MSYTNENKDWVVEEIGSFGGKQMPFLQNLLTRWINLHQKDRVYTANKLRASWMEIWTIKVWTSPPSELNCWEVVWRSLITHQICGRSWYGGRRVAKVCQLLPPAKPFRIPLPLFNVFPLCLLTTVQFDMDTLLCLSSSRRWYWNHWLIHKYKCTFQNFVLLIMLSSYQGKELHILRISYSCHKV